MNPLQKKNSFKICMSTNPPNASPPDCLEEYVYYKSFKTFKKMH